MSEKMSFLDLESLQSGFLHAQQCLDSLLNNIDTCLMHSEFLSIILEKLSVLLEELNRQCEELITDHQELESHYQCYQELFEFAPDAYLVTDSLGMIQLANQAASVLLNASQEALIGKPLVIFVAEADRQTFCNQHWSDEVAFRNWELSLQPEHHEVLPVMMAASAVYNPKNQLIGWRWLIRDITDLKRAEAIIRSELEKEKEMSSRKSLFIQALSHELRSPLCTIYTSTELLELQRIQVGEEAQQCLCTIRESVERANDLMEEVLLFSKTEVGRLEVNPSIVDLAQFCQRLVQVHQLSAGDRYSIQCMIDEQSYFCDLDDRLLRQILDNLLSNALKYSPEGGIIRLELHHQENHIIVQIQDQGIGIPITEQSKLFEPFYRASNVGIIPGTGLGLAIVKKAVDLIGGAIAIKSEMGAGTTVTVTLPNVKC
jgi:two-component system, OmpR family, sensor histidine kinase VicK